MPVPTAITDLSTTAAANSPAGSDPIRPELDNYLRAFASFIAQNYASLAGKQAALGYTPMNKAGDTATGAQAFTKGTAALPGITFSGDTNTGIHSSGADILDLVTAGVAQWRIDASGRLVCPAREQPCFRGVGSANRTTAGTFDTYTSETDDTASFDASTGIFTAPVDGWYEFSATIRVPLTVAAGACVAVGYISDSGANHAVGQALVTPEFASDPYINLSTGPVRLSAGATVKTNFTTHGSAHTIGNAYCGAFAGRLLG